MNRDELQVFAAGKLAEKRRLICQWATSLGKSGVVMKFLKSNPNYRTLILVPEVDNIQNWKKEFEKFDVPDDNVVLSCYASLQKHENTGWDLLVLDEVPHINTEKRLKILRTVTADHVLALGAVVTQDVRESLKTLYGDFFLSLVSLENAISILGILPTPEVYVCHKQLDSIDRKYLHNGRALTELEVYRIFQEKTDAAVSAYNLNPNKFTRMKMLRAGNERKRFLGGLKEDALRIVTDRLSKLGKRFLCFCSSIKQAESLGGDRAYTSKTPASMKLLEKFNNHEIDSLFVVGKLIEGQNLKDIEYGVIGQLGGTERITVQSIGRIMRAEKPKVFVLTIDGTKDEGFLYTVTNNIPIDCIKHYKI